MFYSKKLKNYFIFNNNMNKEILKKSFLEKSKNLSQNEKRKYEIVLNFISNIDEEILWDNPEYLYSKITQNPQWTSINTWETNFSKLTALINITNENLGKIYNEYRKDKIKNQTKNYSNNRTLKSFHSLNYTGDSDTDYKILLLNLYIKYPPLRSDYYTVKLRNFNPQKDNYYKDSVIYFNYLVKNDNKLEVKLENEEKNIIESLNSEYLFQPNTKTSPENMANLFTRTISKYSQELFGKSVSINEFRRKYFTQIMNLTKGKDFPEAYQIVKDVAQKSNTSIEQIINYYYGKIE